MSYEQCCELYADNAKYFLDNTNQLQNPNLSKFEILTKHIDYRHIIEETPILRKRTEQGKSITLIF